MSAELAEWLPTIAWILATLWVAYRIVRMVAEIRQARREAAAAVEAARQRVKARQSE